MKIISTERISRFIQAMADMTGTKSGRSSHRNTPAGNQEHAESFKLPEQTVQEELSSKKQRCEGIPQPGSAPAYYSASQHTKPGPGSIRGISESAPRIIRSGYPRDLYLQNLMQDYIKNRRRGKA